MKVKNMLNQPEPKEQKAWGYANQDQINAFNNGEDMSSHLGLDSPDSEWDKTGIKKPNSLREQFYMPQLQVQPKLPERHQTACEELASLNRWCPIVQKNGEAYEDKLYGRAKSGDISDEEIESALQYHVRYSACYAIAIIKVAKKLLEPRRFEKIKKDLLETLK